MAATIVRRTSGSDRPRFAAPPTTPSSTRWTSCTSSRPRRRARRGSWWDGKAGKAVRFSFDQDACSTFFTSNHRGTPAWDKAAGLFLLQAATAPTTSAAWSRSGDDDYGLCHDFAFPLENTGVDEGGRLKARPRPRPARREVAAARPGGGREAFADLPPTFFENGGTGARSGLLLRDRRDPGWSTKSSRYGRLHAGRSRRWPGRYGRRPQAITVVTMATHLPTRTTGPTARRELGWPCSRTKSSRNCCPQDTANPARRRHAAAANLVLIPTWSAKAPEPDLVTICFGGNDWDAGMRGKQFRQSYQDAVDRVRRATHGKADVLIISTVPAASRWGVAALAEACRQARRPTARPNGRRGQVFTAAGTTRRRAKPSTWWTRRTSARRGTS